MCGLFGVIFKSEKHKKESINQAARDMQLGLIYNQSRGTHSTGIGTNTFYYKDVEEAKDFVMDNDFISTFRTSLDVVGHTRFATMGARTADNAHPFPHRHIMGTHNGWIKLYEHQFAKIMGVDVGWKDSEPEVKRKVKEAGIDMPEVDSSGIYKVLSEKGMGSIEQWEGAMALAWLDDSTGSAYIYRRESKPLFMGYTDYGMLYSSMKEPLTAIGCKGVKEVPTDVVLEYTQAGGKRVLKKHPMKKPKATIKLDESPTLFWTNVGEDHPMLEAKPRYATTYGGTTYTSGSYYSYQTRKSPPKEEKDKSERSYLAISSKMSSNIRLSPAGMDRNEDKSTAFEVEFMDSLYNPMPDIVAMRFVDDRQRVWLSDAIGEIRIGNEYLDKMIGDGNEVGMFNVEVSADYSKGEWSQYTLLIERDVVNNYIGLIEWETEWVD